jgi:hypothetical protein
MRQVHRWRTETAVTYFSLGFLAGLILGFASCAEPAYEPIPSDQITTQRESNDSE